MSYAFPPGRVYNRYKVDERVFTIRKDDKAAVIYEFMQVLFAAANAHQDNDDVRELRYIATQILNKNFSDPSIHPMYILQHLNEWAKAAKTEQITGFLTQYRQLPPPQGQFTEDTGFNPHDDNVNMGGRRRKTKKSKRRARKTRRRHK
jgi:hypothetical protein